MNQMQPEFDIKRYHTYTGHLASKAMEEKAKQGHAMNMVPLGYRRVWVSDERRVEIDPVAGPLIKQAFEEAVRVRTSLQKIMTKLGSQGLASRMGTPLRRTSLYRILINPFYTGKLLYNGQVYSGQHPALVSPKLFDRVQERLTQRRHMPGRHAKNMAL